MIKIIKNIQRFWVRRNSKSFIAYLRSKGVVIGENCIMRSPSTTRIDIQRPELITIGNNVDMNMNFQIMTHDWGSLVFRAKYHDFINSTGRVIIGSNIYFGTDVIILKGVTIGDNCIIGAGSLVTKSIPANSVAAGIPCKVVCSIDDYYQKRKEHALKEAVERVKCFEERRGRRPLPKELKEEFIYYVNSDNVGMYEELGVPVKSQLREAYEDWLVSHKESLFPDFDGFISYCENN
jgi:hypothetical protein